MATVGQATINQLTPKQLIRALSNLSPDISGMVVGLHGIGKSQISVGVAQFLRDKHPEYEWPVFDRRLAQMTEGDLIGIPDVASMNERPVTKFLPTDWWQAACDAPAVIILEELNRAEVQMMNGGFQIVGARELNGNKLHPLTRVLTCINPPGLYQVQEVDKALLDRFAVFWLKVDVEDWLSWARGKLDDAIVDFIMCSPQYLHHDPSSTAVLEVAPTPRSWEKLDIQLKYADIPPSECSGRAAPDLLPIYTNALVGLGASIAFLKWLRNREQFLSVEDVLDNWTSSKIQKLAKSLRHEEILACVSRLGDDAKSRIWTKTQADNLVAFGMACLSGEDKVALFTAVTKSGNTQNIILIHNTPLTAAVVKASNAAQELGERRGGK